MERMAKLKNMDIDYQADDVLEFNELDNAQVIGNQSLSKQKENITNNIVRKRFIITLFTLFVMLVLLIVLTSI